jgi:prepilin signal peptidase PulO-like enzyme (type II secretory pathway)
MLDIVNTTLGLPLECLAAAVLGAVAAYVTAFAADVAETLPEEGVLLPPMARAMMRGRIHNQGRLWTVLICAFLCGILPLITPVSLTVLATFIVLAVPASVMDIRLLIIPEEFTWALLFSGALLSPWNVGAEDAIFGAMLAAGVTWIAMTGMEYRTGLPMRSGGDIAAAAAGGAWVGFFPSGVFVFSACIVFMLYTVLCAKLSGADRWVPMGPALLAAIPLTPVIMPLVEDIAARAL